MSLRKSSCYLKAKTKTKVVNIHFCYSIKQKGKIILCDFWSRTRPPSSTPLLWFKRIDFPKHEWHSLLNCSTYYHATWFWTLYHAFHFSTYFILIIKLNNPLLMAINLFWSHRRPRKHFLIFTKHKNLHDSLTTWFLNNEKENVKQTSTYQKWWNKTPTLLVVNKFINFIWFF